MVNSHTGQLANPLHVGDRVGRPDTVQMAWFVVGMVLTFTVGVTIRAAYLAGPMRYDESYNYLNFVVRGPLYISTHYVPNNHILHTLLVWVATKLAGDAPAALRLPAFLAGIGLIPATAWLAWSLTSRLSAALLSGLAVCCSSALIEYSVNARGYSMLALLAVLNCHVLLCAIKHPEKRWRWLLWGLVGAAGMYTVPIMALPLVAMTAWCGIAMIESDSGRRVQILRGLTFGLATCGGATLLAYLPIWCTGGFTPFTGSQEMVSEILGQQIPTSTRMISLMFMLWTRHMSVILFCVIGFGAMAYLVRSTRSGGLVRALLPLIVLVPILLATITKAPLPARTWLFTLPFVLLISAIGLDGLVSAEGGIGGWLLNKSIQAVAALLFLGCLLPVWQAGVLCSEPGGLVLVEPALQECQVFGADHCALVAPYNPATAYYKVRRPQPLSDPKDPAVRRVYIVTNSQTSLEQLWRPDRDGFDLYERPRLVWSRSGGSLYVAERVERNALR